MTELLNIPTQHAWGEEAVGAAFTLVEAGAAIGGGWTTPPSITIRGTKKGAKGGKKGKVPPASSHRNAGKEIENSDEEFMAAAEREFKRCTRPPKDHFEKILEATYPHHPYPVKHKHRNCTMMRRFMSSAGTSLGSDELVGDPRGRGMVLEEVSSAADYDLEPKALCG
jgi:hypothetical protein